MTTLPQSQVKKMFQLLVFCLALLLPFTGRAGETEKIIQFNITGSQTTHAPRTYDVQLGTPVNGTLGTPSRVTLTINSGSGAPAALSLRLLDPIVDRAGTTGTTQRFAVDRTGDISGASSVTWQVSAASDNPAATSDFVGGAFPSGAIGFSSGETSKTSTISIAGKTAPSSSVAYVITLSSPTGANLGTPSTVTAQVQNEGIGAQTIWSISSATPSVDRGEAGTTQSVDVTRTNGSGSASVSVSTAPGGSVPATEDDFSPSGFPSFTASFSALETKKRLSWSIAGKAGAGPTVTYDATLSAPSAGTIGTGTTRLTVLDSGPAGEIVIPARINSGGTLLSLDTAGNQWGVDQYYTGGTTITTTSAIAGTLDDALFQKQRQAGPVKYTLLGLPTGQRYDITMLFAEIASSQSGSCTLSVAGARKMDLFANGELVEAGIDPCFSSGFETALVKDFRGLSPDAESKIVLELRANASATLLPALAGFYIRLAEETPTAQRFLFFGNPDASSYEDVGGNMWVPGDHFIPECEAHEGSLRPIVGTANPQLYQSWCAGPTLTVRVPVDTSEGADRTIYLGFSEPEASAAGQRLMNVTVEGASAATNLDVLTASGGPDRAYRLRRDVTLSDDTLDVILTGTTSMPAILNNLSILTPTAAPTVDHVASTSWKSEFLLPKNTIVKAFAPPRGVAASGNSLVVRDVDDTGSTMFVNHAPCPASPTHGEKTDDTNTDTNFYLCVTTWDPENHSDSLFTIDPNSSVVDTFTVSVCEVDRVTGETLNCQPFTVGVRVSRVS